VPVSFAGIGAAVQVVEPLTAALRAAAGPAHERAGRRPQAQRRGLPLVAVNAPHLVALVRAGAVFEAGNLVERPDEHP
jgi:hypothetical protein